MMRQLLCVLAYSCIASRAFFVTAELQVCTHANFAVQFVDVSVIGEVLKRSWCACVSVCFADV